MIVWFNGTLADVQAVRIDPADRGFTLGDGVFETLAARQGRPQRLAGHLARLRHGAAVLGLPVPDLDFGRILTDLLVANGQGDGALRLTLTRGPAPRGVLPPDSPNPTMLVTVGPLPPPLPPARCILATLTRRNEHSPLAGIKSLNYLDNILARREAADRQADEAILLNTAGRLAEATAANLFVVRGGRVLTPPIGDGALPGIMRAAVLAATNGREQPLAPIDLDGADEVFLTSSLGVRPVRAVDGHVFAAVPGPVTRDLMVRMAEPAP